MPVVEWIEQSSAFNTTSTNGRPTIVTDSAGNSYVAYATQGSSAGGANVGSWDVVIFKMNALGDVVWITQAATFDTTAADEDPDIGIDAAGNVYCVFKTEPQLLRAVKLNSAGTVQWVTNPLMGQFGGASPQRPRIAVDALGNSYITCTTIIVTPRIDVFKLDTNGTLVWTNLGGSYNSPSGNNSDSEIAIDASGNCFLTLYTTGAVTGAGNSASGQQDVVVAKLDVSGGTSVWSRQFPSYNTTQGDIFSSIKTDSSGNIYVAYSTLGSVPGSSLYGTVDVVLAKFTPSGTLEWVTQSPTINTIGSNVVPRFVLDSNRNIYLTYFTTHSLSGVNLGGNYNVTVLQCNDAGTRQWIVQTDAFNTNGLDDYPRIGIDATNNLYIAYSTTGTTVGNTKTGSATDVVVFKLVRNATITVTINGSGTVTCAALGVTITGPGTQSFVVDTNTLASVTLEASASSSTVFGGWTGGATSLNATVTLTPTTTSQAIIASFVGGLPAPANSVAMAANYVPSQTERADQLHQLQCPCAEAPPAFSDYATRTRAIRSLATGCCVRWAVASISVTDGTGYTTNSYLQLVGGAPVAQPLLVKVTAVDGSGGIVTVAVVYAGQYYEKPTAPYSMRPVGGTVDATLTTTITWVEECPCPWTYRPTVTGFHGKTSCF